LLLNELQELGRQHLALKAELEVERQEKEVRLVALEGMVKRLATPSHRLTGLAQ